MNEIKPELFRPLKPMFVQTANGLSEALRELKGRLALEYKYDGARVQIHKSASDVKIFSRRLTDISRALPEVATQAQAITASKAILEGEVIGVDKNSRPLPFQHIMRRLRRVKEVESMVQTVPVKVFLFDCLYCDNELLIDLAYEERWQRLEKIKGHPSTGG